MTRSLWCEPYKARKSVRGLAFGPTYDPRTSGFRYATTEQERMLASTMGIASDGTRLYVSNYRLDTIDIFNIATRAYVGSFSGGSSHIDCRASGTP